MAREPGCMICMVRGSRYVRYDGSECNIALRLRVDILSLCVYYIQELLSVYPVN